MLDAARLSDGIGFHGDTLAFSWPSKAKLLDYGYDRDSARYFVAEEIDAILASWGVARRLQSEE